MDAVDIDTSVEMYVMGHSVHAMDNGDNAVCLGWVVHVRSGESSKKKEREIVFRVGPGQATYQKHLQGGTSRWFYVWKASRVFHTEGSAEAFVHYGLPRRNDSSRRQIGPSPSRLEMGGAVILTVGRGVGVVRAGQEFRTRGWVGIPQFLDQEGQLGLFEGKATREEEGKASGLAVAMSRGWQQGQWVKRMLRVLGRRGLCRTERGETGERLERAVKANRECRIGD